MHAQDIYFIWDNLMSINVHPYTGVAAPVLAPHHVRGIMSAIDTGTEAPNTDNPPHPLVESHIPNSENDVGRFGAEFGFSENIKALVSSLPFKDDKDMEGLLFNRELTNSLSPHQELMVSSIIDENMRQEMNVGITPIALPGSSLTEALGGEDGLTPPDADPLRTGSWKSLRAR